MNKKTNTPFSWWNTKPPCGYLD